MDTASTTEVTQSYHEITKAFQSAFVPNDTRPIYEWAADNVNLQGGYSIKGQFQVSPHFKKIFDAFQNPYVREVNILAPPRSGKTMIAELCLLYSIVNSSGDVLWLQLSDEKAKQLTDLRMIPLLKSCLPVANLIDFNSKYAITEQRFKFLHSTVHVTSPKENALNAVGYKYVFADEVWKYEKYGDTIIEEIKRRTDDFIGVNKCMFFSQGGVKGSPWHKQYNSGEVFEYGWTCPHCDKLQRFDWRSKRADGTPYGIVWPDDSTTKDTNGKWIIPECGKKAVLECLYCRGHVIDTPQNRKRLVDGGDYIKVNAVDNPTVQSFRFTNLCNVKIPFSKLVGEFLTANQHVDYIGERQLLQDFVQANLADFWDEYVRNKRTEIKIADYDTGKPFGEFEAFKFLTIDCQNKEPFFYWVIRAWTRNGDSRLIAFGTANTWKELEAIRERNGVLHNFTFVDSGDGPNTEKIYSECVKHGEWGVDADNEERWLCFNSLKGSGVMGWQHPDGKYYRYKEPEEFSIASDNEEDEGKTLVHTTFSSFRMSAILETLRDGKGRKWEAADVTQEYVNHLNSTLPIRDYKTGKWVYVTKPNEVEHYWDCEKMQVVAADLFSFLSVNDTPPAPIEPKADDSNSVANN